MEYEKRYGAVALYSGGVDSTAAPLLARQKLKIEMLLLMMDLGEGNSSLGRAKQRADILKMDFTCIDGKRDFADRYLSEAIKMNGEYWGYPLITPLSRAYIMETAFEFLAETDTRFIVHGCTEKQNTRYQIEAACTMYPNITAYSPFVAQPLSRLQKIALLEAAGVPCSQGSEVAEDINIWGRAIEGESLNDLKDVDGKDVFMLTRNLEDTPDVPQQFSLEFYQGVPVALNNSGMSLDEIITKLSKLGGLHGVGRIVGFEDTIPELGYKEMGIYESPASRMIYALHRHIEAAVLNQTERKYKRQMEQEWAEIVYRGGWFDSNRRELSAISDRYQTRVSGKVNAKVFKGHVLIGSADIPGNLLIQSGQSRSAY